MKTRVNAFRRKIPSTRLSFVILAALLARPLFAIEMAGVVQGRPSGLPKVAGAPSPDFGTSFDSVTSLWAGGFAVSYNPNLIFIKENNSGYCYLTSTLGVDTMASGISIPTGVTIDFVQFENCDYQGGDFTLTLFDNDVVVSQFSSTTGGCGWNSSGAIGYAFNTNLSHSLRLYIYQSSSAPADGTEGVRGINVAWSRKVSPAPVTSDFGDVPTSSQQFQFIEALYNSGITAGCGGGNYCPNQPLTRGQMAVFLAKALGLHWPY